AYRAGARAAAARAAASEPGAAPDAGDPYQPGVPVPYAREPYGQEEQYGQGEPYPEGEQPYGSEQPYGQQEPEQPYGQQEPEGQEGTHARDPYAEDPYAPDPYGPESYAPDPYAQEPYPRDPYAPGGVPGDEDESTTRLHRGPAAPGASVPRPPAAGSYGSGAINPYEKTPYEKTPYDEMPYDETHDDEPRYEKEAPPSPAAGSGAPEPAWWSQAPDRAPGPDGAYDEHEAYGDEHEEHDERGDDGEAPRSVHLTGSWSDGPGGPEGAGPVPAGGTGGFRTDALRADAQRRLPAPAQPLPAQVPATGRWDEVVGAGGAPAFRGPATPREAERARLARIAVVGAVTERWAPEQAGPVHDTWQLAPPIGPATDLWALGALLYRAVQGHAPYPEENAAELVQLVCAEPPAFAEDCGPLRPVVESLLRQDPTERPDFEELRGWLRSLIRSAPEPDAGIGVVPLPSAPTDGSKLPIVRRRGELVRKRRAGASDAHGRHRHKKVKERSRRAEREVREVREVAERPPNRKPRSLGRMLLLLILLLLAAAVAYAMLFLPRNEGTSGAGSEQPDRPGQSQQPQPQPQESTRSPQPEQPPAATPQGPSPTVAAGYVLRKDPEGFQLAVDKNWRRSPINDAGQVRYTNGDFTLIVVPGRDTVQSGGSDPMAYQRTKERELQPWRDSAWASASGLRTIDVGQQHMAEGQFTWQDASGREVFVRNLAMLVGGRYHVVQVIGPDAQRDKVSEAYAQATNSYKATR
ncbi:serine/threonine protein kinase, partial [Streptomyces sp. NPDC001941]|uniref:serine/threonine protein kinase n=1 Tax=Streptomyces sp. NPDC001941 TaxID=3154659 RepID=UPI0033244BF5